MVMSDMNKIKVRNKGLEQIWGEIKRAGLF